jgi:hypothetical protein
MTSARARPTSGRPAGRNHVFLAIAAAALIVAVGFALFVDADSWLSDFGIGFAGLGVSQAAIWLHLIAAPLRIRLTAFAVIALVPWLCWLPADGDARENLRAMAVVVSILAVGVACLAVQEHRKQSS